MSWDYEVEECAELGHEFVEGAVYDITADAMTYEQYCTWCGIGLEG